jgi:leucyl aminopeptidase (aminopeptidase T)
MPARQADGYSGLAGAPNAPVTSIGRRLMTSNMYWYEAVDVFPKYGRISRIFRTARTIAESAINVKPGESVLLVTDYEVSPLIYFAIAGAVTAVGGVPAITVMDPLTVPGSEPPAAVAAAMLTADKVVNLCSRSISHSRAAHEVWLQRRRPFVIMPNLTEDMLLHGAATADYARVREITLTLVEELNAGTIIRVTSEAGTDITFDTTGRPFTPYYGILEPPHTVTVFPGGECGTCPVEDSGNGVVVVDSYIMEVGRLDQPVVWIVRNGRVVDIQGGREAQTLKRILETRGDEFSYNIGELAVGTNYAARRIGSALEDKEVYGDVHIAVGTGDASHLYDYRPRYQSTLHLDGVLRQPTVTVNDRVVVERGLILSAPPPG